MANAVLTRTSGICMPHYAHGQGVHLSPFHNDMGGEVAMALGEGGGATTSVSVRMAELITPMWANIERLQSFFPEVDIVWSKILPCVVWQGMARVRLRVPAIGVL